MIDISPKALRFARLAAEQQSAFADDPQITIIRQKEETHRLGSTIRKARRYVDIPETTAEFCVRVMIAFLEQPSRFQSSEWDGNDFVFLQAAAKSLKEQLTGQVVRGL